MSALTALPLDIPLPWLAQEWARLQGALRDKRLAHALLVSGPKGVGKRHLIGLFTRSILCSSPSATGAPCGICEDCLLLHAGSHPDRLHVGPDPEAKSQEISVAAVRAMVERGSLTASRGSRKITLIDPADHLTTAAANALLKTLEEPPGDALLCLITERPSRLPATVRSRCQHMRLPVPERTQALSWLAGRIAAVDLEWRLSLAQGAPLRLLDGLDAQELKQYQQRREGFIAIALGRRDPVAEAALWHAGAPLPILEWLSIWLVDLLRWGCSDAPARVVDPQCGEAFKELARRIDARGAHRLLRRVWRFRALSEMPLNTQLMCESLAIEWWHLSHASLSRTG